MKQYSHSALICQIYGFSNGIKMAYGDATFTFTCNLIQVIEKVKPKRHNRITVCLSILLPCILLFIADAGGNHKFSIILEKRVVKNVENGLLCTTVRLCFIQIMAAKKRWQRKKKQTHTKNEEWGGAKRSMWTLLRSN